MLLSSAKIILASASPRRTELMRQAGLEFTVAVADVKEHSDAVLPSDFAMELALLKANSIYQQQYAKDNSPAAPLVVIGADTIVVFNNQILGKPKDETDAFQILKQLSGQTHQVYTGVAFVYNDSNTVSSKQIHTFFEATDVTLYPLSDDEIWSYIHSGDPMDKAGAYGIQGPFGIYVKEIQGDYNNVVGLPIARLWHELIAL